MEFLRTGEGGGHGGFAPERCVDTGGRGEPNPDSYYAFGGRDQKVKKALPRAEEKK